MSSGGARTRSGPAPDPSALAREHDAGEWTILPPAGRVESVPDWPLTEGTGRELELWVRLWAKPQGLMWERLSQEFEVALYVRRLVEAEEPGSKVTVGTLVRQMADSLGLTTPGMRANRWRVAKVELETDDGDETPATSSVRSRLTVVPNADNGA